uniref:hypothetical protein n=1 Tax=Acetatifactor sp. TaxID=1872090 RepID=UPI0040562EB2
MKTLKKITALLLAAAICALLPNATVLTASAEEPVTYYVKHVDGQGWRFQIGSWADNGYHRELYYMYQDIKDGDLLVVDGSNIDNPIEVSVRLSNLTYAQNTSAVVYAKSIDNCYVLRDNFSAVNGDVTNAYIYDTTACTFNNNVGTLNILNDPGRIDSLLHANVTVGGTVNHLIGNDGNTVHYDLYNFAAGKLVITQGDVKTDPAYFSTTASSTAAPSVPAQTVPADTASDDEYDDVPQTGDSSLWICLLGISAICFAGSYQLKKVK